MLQTVTYGVKVVGPNISETVQYSDIDIMRFLSRLQMV